VADRISFRFSGGEQFLVDLDRWRDRLRAEVHQAALTEAQAIATAVQAQYPHGKTGKLRAGVRVKDESPSLDGILLRVRSLAPHSHLVERGTVARATRRGWNRGTMPETPIFVPEAIDRREAFKRKVRKIVGSPEPAIGHGSPTVTGSL
jgi:hypothetical protein